VTFLIDQGADKDAYIKGWEHFTPLTYAIGSEDPQMVELLVDKGADPNKGHFRGTSINEPMLITVVTGRPYGGEFRNKNEIIKALVKKKQPEVVNAKFNGHTALYYAEHAKLVDLLTTQILRNAGAESE